MEQCERLRRLRLSAIDFRITISSLARFTSDCTTSIFACANTSHKSANVPNAKFSCTQFNHWHSCTATNLDISAFQVCTNHAIFARRARTRADERHMHTRTAAATAHQRHRVCDDEQKPGPGHIWRSQSRSAWQLSRPPIVRVLLCREAIV